jgi:uncharacterized membrane protein
MKNKILCVLSALLFGISFLSTACKKKKDKKETATVSCDGRVANYNMNIKSIIDANCVSCHSTYSTYSGLKISTDNGSFAREVLDRRTMPKNASLSADALSLLQCWKESGYPDK